MGHKTLLLINLASLIFEASVAVNPGCNYFQYLEVGTVYYISNKEYPSFYGPGTDCLWSSQSPSGTKILLTCDEINLPSTSNCNSDKLKISLSGDVNFADSRIYCGVGSITLISNANYIAIGLVGNGSRYSGRFTCTLAAVNSFEPTTTTTSPTTCDCGWKRATKITGGVPTLVNEYPAMAGLIDAQNREVFCGSTIISDRYVLTAAHCVRYTNKENMGILVGDWNISSGMDTAAAALYLVENYWEHPDFNTDLQINDLAIVKTQKQIQFSLLVGPICLPFLYSFATFDLTNVTMLGWGQQFFNGPTSDVLLKVDVQVVANSYCQSRFPNNVITSNQICTYAPNKDACQRDSGGPVFWQDPNTKRLQLIGVISYGFACASTRPGVNTRVTNYLNWIVSITRDTNYCIL